MEEINKINNNKEKEKQLKKISKYNETKVEKLILKYQINNNNTNKINKVNESYRYPISGTTTIDRIYIDDINVGWVANYSVRNCQICERIFSLIRLRLRHHCRSCGRCICRPCIFPINSITICVFCAHGYHRRSIRQSIEPTTNPTNKPTNEQSTQTADEVIDPIRLRQQVKIDLKRKIRIKQSLVTILDKFKHVYKIKNLSDHPIAILTSEHEFDASYRLNNANVNLGGGGFRLGFNIGLSNRERVDHPSFEIIQPSDDINAKSIIRKSFKQPVLLTCFEVKNDGSYYPIVSNYKLWWGEQIIFKDLSRGQSFDINNQNHNNDSSPLDSNDNLNEETHENHNDDNNNYENHDNYENHNFNDNHNVFVEEPNNQPRSNQNNNQNDDVNYDENHEFHDPSNEFSRTVVGSSKELKKKSWWTRWFNKKSKSNGDNDNHLNSSFNDVINSSFDNPMNRNNNIDRQIHDHIDDPLDNQLDNQIDDHIDKSINRPIGDNNNDEPRVDNLSNERTNNSIIPINDPNDRNFLSNTTSNYSINKRFNSNTVAIREPVSENSNRDDTIRSANNRNGKATSRNLDGHIDNYIDKTIDNNTNRNVDIDKYSSYNRPISSKVVDRNINSTSIIRSSPEVISPDDMAWIISSNNITDLTDQTSSPYFKNRSKNNIKKSNMTI